MRSMMVDAGTALNNENGFSLLRWTGDEETRNPWPTIRGAERVPEDFLQDTWRQTMPHGIATEVNEHSRMLACSGFFKARWETLREMDSNLSVGDASFNQDIIRDAASYVNNIGVWNVHSDAPFSKRKCVHVWMRLYCGVMFGLCGSESQIERACEIMTMGRREVETEEKEFEAQMEMWEEKNEREVVRESVSLVDWTHDDYLGKWFLLARQTGARLFQVARMVGREDSEPYVYLELWKFKNFWVNGKRERLLTAEHVLANDKNTIPDFPIDEMDGTTWAMAEQEDEPLELTPETQYRRAKMSEFSGMYVEPWETSMLEQVIEPSIVDNDFLSSPKYRVSFLLRLDVCGRFTAKIQNRYFGDWKIDDV